jgi:hypothetical protein
MDPQLEAQSLLLDPTSQVYLGRWNGLVSTTNWEKGRIIVEWRTALMAGGAPPAEYADEAWSRFVGNVSSQHVGRLRRVYERFASVRDEFPGLYWSHFSAALDWHDAEMWLEGAVQSNWSISQMRRQRWEATGATPAEEPQPGDVVVAEWDEDTTVTDDGVEAVRDVDDSSAHGPGERADIDPGFRAEPPPETDEPQPGGAQPGVPFEAALADEPAASPVRPFADLPALPDDLAEAVEQFKLALLRHKVEGWQQVPRQDVLAWIDALRQLALAE